MEKYKTKMSVKKRMNTKIQMMMMNDVKVKGDRYCRYRSFNRILIDNYITALQHINVCKIAKTHSM